MHVQYPSLPLAQNASAKTPTPKQNPCTKKAPNPKTPNTAKFDTIVAVVLQSAVIIRVMDVWKIRLCAVANAKLVEDIKPSMALSNIKVADNRRR